MILKAIIVAVFWIIISFLCSLPCLLWMCDIDFALSKMDADDIERIIHRNFDNSLTFLAFFLLSPLLLVVITICFVGDKLISALSIVLHIIWIKKHGDDGGLV